MTPTALRLASLQVRFGQRLALDVDRLSIAEGGLHLLMGPNGSGKSTLLGVLALLRRPDSGHLAFGEVPVNWSRKQLGKLRKQVTLLHQQSYLFAGSVMANVGFGLRLRGAEREEVRHRVKDTLALVGLAGFETRNAAQLSGGEARRVALARALACRPKVLLLDEPLAHVDQESADVIENLIAAQSRDGTTIIMANHDDRVAARLPSRVVRLKDGRIVTD